MPKPWRGPFPWLAAVFAADAAVTAGAGYALAQGEADRQALMALTLVALAGAAAMFALSWKIVDYLMVRAVRRMAAEVRAFAHGGSRAVIDAERYGLISPLPEAVNELSARLVEARARLAEGLDAATASAEENAARLAAILNDLHEGVVVCTLRHQVVLYNQVATDMLAGVGQIGLSRPLFETVARAPVIHTLSVLTNRPELAGRGMPFLAGSADGRLLLQARMTLIRDSDGGATGYVVTLVDAGPQVAALARRDALLREVAEKLDAPLRRLRAAAGDAAAVEREAAGIARAVEHVTAGYHHALAGWWPSSDLLSADLLAFVARHVEEGMGIKVAVTGLPVWLHADSHSLALAVEALVRHVAGQQAREVDLAAGAGDDEAWLDIVCSGEAVEETVLDGWMAQPLAGLGGMTVRDVLVHHAGDGVVQVCEGGTTRLRLPMRKAVEVHLGGRQGLPARPEFYDLSLLAQAQDTGTQGGESLRGLTYVVFDTETTGLQPSAGDRIVQVGAVRVVNGRILSGESFDRIVNPGRPIPPESVRFHGITDEMVKGKPPIGVVLPQFAAFAAGAVLVAHNAAFDLKFVRMREQDCGVTLDNPVLDTMILSNYLDGPDCGHSLDDICARYGIDITDRHTALGDAMVTAAVLLRQIEALETRGITTLDQAVKALDLSLVLHQRQQAL